MGKRGRHALSVLEGGGRGSVRADLRTESDRNNKEKLKRVFIHLSISVAVRSKTSVCGLSLADIWVRILPVAWKLASRECCVLSGVGFTDGLITRPEKSYRMLCV